MLLKVMMKNFIKLWIKRWITKFIYLDIETPNGNGIDIAKKIRSKDYQEELLKKLKKIFKLGFQKIL